MISYHEIRRQFSVERPKESGYSDVISLNQDFLTDPLDFIHYSAENRHIALQRMEHYHIFVSNPVNKGNYAPRPLNVAYDAQNILTLYSEFGPPTLDEKLQADSLAVCGFNITDCKGEIVGSDELVFTPGAVINVAQFQTTAFKDEREMMHYLGFIKYKKLFLHIVEQAALYLRDNSDQEGIRFVSLANDDRKDKFMAKQRILAEISPKKETKEAKEKRMQEGIREERLKLAIELGYDRLIQVPVYGNIGGHISFAKSVDDIEPDEILQRHLAQIMK